jgi:hypothetical protein
MVHFQHVLEGEFYITASLVPIVVIKSDRTAKNYSTMHTVLMESKNYQTSSD